MLAPNSIKIQAMSKLLCFIANDNGVKLSLFKVSRFAPAAIM